MTALPHLDRISPSSADQLLNCPRRWYEERVAKSVTREQSRPMLRGSVFHEAIEQIMQMWAAGDDITAEAVGSAIMGAAAGLLPVSDVEELSRALTRLQMPCERDEVLLVEPAQRGPGGYPSPIPQWPAVRSKEWRHSVWGIPDVVAHVDGQPMIVDWKTGFKIMDPQGFAPYAYAAMASANWQLFAGEIPFTWPVRVVWRFVLNGAQRGWRELIIHEDDAWRVLEEMRALVERAEEWHAAGTADAWPELLNEYCWTCPRRMAGCGAHEGHDSGTSAEEMAVQWYRLDQDRKAAETAAKSLQDGLQQLCCAGEEFVYPDGKRLAVEDSTAVRWSLRTQQDLLDLLKLTDELGIDIATILTIDGRAMSDLGLRDDPAFARYRTPDGKASVRITRR